MIHDCEKSLFSFPLTVNLTANQPNNLARSVKHPLFFSCIVAAKIIRTAQESACNFMMLIWVVVYPAWSKRSRQQSILSVNFWQ